MSTRQSKSIARMKTKDQIISDYMRQLGRSKSAAKQRAARSNGRLGGRPVTRKKENEQ